MSLSVQSFLGRLFLLMLLSSGSVTAVFAGTESWTSIGPSGGQILALAGDPSSDNVVYVGTNNGIFKSTSGGASWSAINNGIRVPSNVVSVQALAIDPTNTNIVYAGTPGNILKSANGGMSWTEVESGKSGSIAVLVIDPSHTDTIYAGVLDRGILKSDDAGATWIWKNAGLTNLRVVSVAIDPSNTKTIYAATYDGIYKSTNGGDSWNSASVGLMEPPGAFARVQSLAIDLSESAVVYAGTFAGLYRSTNGGGTWTPIGTEATAICSIAIERSNPSVIYAGTRPGILTSTDKGATWISKTNGPFGYVFSIHLTSSGDLYAGTLNGVFKSADRGVAWTAVNDGINNTGIRAIAIDRSDPRTIYAGSDDQEVFKTVDGGVSWTQGSRGANRINALAIDPSNSRIIYKGVDGGLLKSTNSGAKWDLAFDGMTDPYILSLAINPANTNIVYAGSRDGHVFKSTNGGAKWAGFSVGLTGKEIVSLQIDPSDTKTVYAAAQRGGVFKSIDSGASWAAINAGINLSDDFLSVRAIAIDPSRTSTVYAGTVIGVFKSTNGGANWGKADDRVTWGSVHALAIDPLNTNIIYAGTGDKGVLRSMDGGQTWSEFGAGLTSRCVASLAIYPAKTSTIYAGTLGAGIFQWPSKTSDASPVDSDQLDRPGMAAGNHLDGPSPAVINKPEHTSGVRKIIQVQRAIIANRSSASDAIVIQTGDILLVRHEGKYGAVQAVAQVSNQDRSSIRYVWWYQPDGSGSFINKNALTGSGETHLIHSEGGPEQILQVGPIALKWSIKTTGQGYVYFWHPDRKDIIYELVISRKTDIRSVDATSEFQR